MVATVVVIVTMIVVIVTMVATVAVHLLLAATVAVRAPARDPHAATAADHLLRVARTAGNHLRVAIAVVRRLPLLQRPQPRLRSPVLVPAPAATAAVVLDPALARPPKVSDRQSWILGCDSTVDSSPELCTWFVSCVMPTPTKNNFLIFCTQEAGGKVLLGKEGL